MLLSMLFLMQGSLEVDGLRPGESLVPSSVEVSEGYARGLVLDAETGRPVEGAVVELWTEEIDVNGSGGARRVASARSAADGGFGLAIRDARGKAEKLRVRAPGYLLYAGSLGDLETVRLMPRPACCYCCCC